MKLNVVLFAVLAGLGLAELGTRGLGLANVPVRSANPITGYIPLPNQHGSFLNHDWTINGLSMISREEYRAQDRPFIVAGDSVVFGGNPLKQSERLGEQLTGLLGEQVFAIADGSWGLKNSLAYFLTRKQDLGSPKKIVLIVNSGDFDKPSAWRCFSHHPIQRPTSHLYFAVRKYLLPECERTTPSNLVVPDFSIASGLAELLRLYPETNISIVLYPTLHEFMGMSRFLSQFQAAAGALDPRIELVDLLNMVERDPSAWNASYYLDGIHPNAQGTKHLAQLIASSALTHTSAVRPKTN